jgi:hypothetical protein
MQFSNAANEAAVADVANEIVIESWETSHPPPPIRAGGGYPVCTGPSFAANRRPTANVEYKGLKYERGSDGRPVGYAYCPVCESNGKMMRTTYVGA